MRHYRHLLPAVVACLSAVASAADPLVEVAVAPSARVIERFAASPYGKVWNDPALKPLREGFADLRQKNADEVGLDIWAVLEAQRGAGFRLFDIGDKMSLAWLADLGEHAADVAAKAKEKASGELTVAGADEAMKLDEMRLARFGSVLRGVVGGEDFPDWKPSSGDDDVVVRADVRALCERALAERSGAPLDPAIPALAAKFGEARLAMRIGTTDLETRFKARCPTAGLAPLTRARLERIPGNAIEVTACGVDGAALWKEFGPAILGTACAASASGGGDPTLATPADAQKAADEALAKVGLPSLPELVAAFHGTELFFSTPGTPMPGYTLVLERNPTLDGVVTALLAMVNVQAPLEGASAALPLPNAPIMPQVLLTHDDWVLTSDPTMTSSWPASGWANSESGKAALANVGSHTVMVSASDIAAQLRMLSGVAGMALGNASDMTPAQKQATMSALTKLAAIATPAWSVARTGNDGIEGEARGAGGSTAVAIVAIAAAIAIPNLLESRVVAQESAAAAGLKSGVLPAEVVFQNGGYVDQDGNGIGEYGFLSEMSGAVEVGGQKLNLLAPNYQQPEPLISGYRFAVYLPNAAGDGAITDPRDKPRPDGPVGERERLWVAYAWPADAKQGRKMFAINQAGNVYFAPYQGQPPEWNALMGGQGWKDEPTWKVYRRR